MWGGNDQNSNWSSLEEIKAIDMVMYLSRLGFEPVKIMNADYWYLSPLRNENTASFKISQRLNRWFDHGLGKGGNLIDFGVAYFNCSVSEFLHKFSNDFSFQQMEFKTAVSGVDKEQGRIRILEVKLLLAKPLICYLRQRKISAFIAREFCKEVHYEMYGKKYFAIGFENDSQGYELRNSFSKVSSSPKGITSLDNGANQVAVFEGIFDFLSYKILQSKIEKEPQNYVVLNSLSMFEKARPFMESHESIRLYLDNDSAGHKCRDYALSINENYKDESQTYNKCKDLNEWLINHGHRQAKGLTL